MFRELLLFTIFCWAGLISFAQFDSNKRADRSMKKAKDLAWEGRWEEAFQLLNSPKNCNTPECVFFRGRAACFAGKYEDSYRDLESIREFYEGDSDFARYFLLAALSSGRAADASPITPKGPAEKESPRNSVQYNFIQDYPYLLKGLPTYRTEHLKWNTSFVEFRPLLFGDSLFLAIDKPRINRSSRFQVGPVASTFELFMVGPEGKVPGDKVVSKARLGMKLSRGSYDEIPVLVQKGAILFSRIKRKGFTGPAKSRLLRSALRKGRFRRPESLPLPQIDPGLPELTLNSEGTLAIFPVRTSPFKSDLFLSRLVNGAWTEPTPLPASTNTPYRERAPFLHPNGYLYFASDGHPGFGGMDIFRIRLDSIEEGRPENLGPFLNGRSDELHYVSGPKDSLGYLTSNRRKGRTDFDLIAFERTLPWFPDLPLQDTSPRNWALTARDNLTQSLEFSPRINCGDGSIIYGAELIYGYDYFQREQLVTVTELVDNRRGKVVSTSAPQEIDLRTKEDLVISGKGDRWAGGKMTFSLERSFLGGGEVTSAVWDFGDGVYARGQEVSHRYRRGGKYEIQVLAEIEEQSTGKRRTLGIRIRINIRENSTPPEQDTLRPSAWMVILGKTFFPFPLEASAFEGLLHINRIYHRGTYTYCVGPFASRIQAQAILAGLPSKGFNRAVLLPVFEHSFAFSSLNTLPRLPLGGSAWATHRSMAGDSIHPEAVRFLKDSDSLSASGRMAWNGVMKWMEQRPKAELEVWVHCLEGKEELSEARLQTLQKLLSPALGRRMRLRSSTSTVSNLRRLENPDVSIRRIHFSNITPKQVP